MGTLSTTNPPRQKSRPSLALSSFLLAAFQVSYAGVSSAQVVSAQVTPPPISSPQAGAANVPATAVPLALPAAIAFDGSGNLYVAETNHHVIRKVDPAGILTTVAGTGDQGYSGDGSAAISAEIDSPGGLAVDAAGNLFIADTRNQRIREVSAASGIITTVAGTGASGFSGDGGPAISARLSNPSALALDANGNLYIADTNNHRVRKLTLATGLIATVAGNGLQMFAGDNGPATSASIDSPAGLTVDPSGRLYIADTHNQRIRVVDPGTHVIRTVAGNGSTGASGDLAAAALAKLARPHGLTSDAAGNLYLTDSQNHRIRRIDAVTGIITTVAGDGVEQFAGDSGPARSASLATPRSAAFSADGKLTVADSGNGRVRQLTAPVQPLTPIQTIAGLGITAPGTFSLSAPSVVAYGTGALTAALLASSTAAGSVSFLETTSGTATLLGTAPLAGNTATLNLSALPVGPHRVTATYTGDRTHPSAQSTSLLLTVSPLQLTAAPVGASMLFGQTPPPLSGSLSGLLPQDTGAVGITFTSSATVLSPAGTYPISAALNGPQSANYTLNLAPAGLIVNRAPAIVTLATASDLASGAVSLTTQVTSSTSGLPTGTVTFLDSLTPFAAVKVNATGASTWTAANLTPGSHSFTAFYSGDANFTSASSAPSVLTLGGGSSATPAADFTLSPTGITSQTISSGNSASFTFSVQLTGAALASPITLAATGLPSLATASFNPAYLPPGGAVSTFTVTIATPKSALLQPGTRSNIKWIASLALLLPLLRVHRRHRPRSPISDGAAALFLLAPLLLLAACGNRVAGIAANTGLKIYTVNITGTATTPTGATLQHAAGVTLNVQ